MSCVFVYVYILEFVNMVVVVFILSTYLYTYGWYAMNYNFTNTQNM